jgi:hypothetical protein
VQRDDWREWFDLDAVSDEEGEKAFIEALLRRKLSRSK